MHHWHYGEKHCGVCPYQCTAYWIQLFLNLMVKKTVDNTRRNQVSTCDVPSAVPRTAAKAVTFLTMSGLLCDVPASYWVTYLIVLAASSVSWFLFSCFVVQFGCRQDDLRQVWNQVRAYRESTRSQLSWNLYQPLGSNPVAKNYLTQSVIQAVFPFPSILRHRWEPWERCTSVSFKKHKLLRRSLNCAKCSPTEIK